MPKHTHAATGLARRARTLALWVRRTGVLLRAAMATVMLGVVGSLVVLRLTLRDRLPVLAPLYYATPPIFLALLAAIAALLWAQARARLLAWLSAGLAVGLALWWHTTTYFYRAAPASNESTLRVCTWNVARGVGGWEGIARQIRALDADIVALVEADDYRRARVPYFEKYLSEYNEAWPVSGLLLLVKGQYEALGNRSLDRGGRYRHFRLRVRGCDLQVVLVDVLSDPFLPRGIALRALQRELRRAAPGPLILLGDFNTPMDSCFFDALRADYQNALEAGGRGYAATWPVPLPVLTIDQIWTSRDITVHSAGIGFTLRSDHAPVIAELRLPTPTTLPKPRE